MPDSSQYSLIRRKSSVPTTPSDSLTRLGGARVTCDTSSASCIRAPRIAGSDPDGGTVTKKTLLLPTRAAHLLAIAPRSWRFQKCRLLLDLPLEMSPST